MEKIKEWYHGLKKQMKMFVWFALLVIVLIILSKIGIL
jgi:predicted ferric reductase